MSVMKKRIFKNGISYVAITLLFIGIIVLINLLFAKYPFRKDITSNKIYELSENTQNILMNLDKSGKKMNVYLFSLDNGYLDAKTENLVLGLLKQFDIESKNINLEIVNLEKNPSLAEKYNLTSGYEVVFETGDRYRVVTLMEMFEGTSFNGESAYASAINYVMNENPPVVYYIQGHKEALLESQITYLKSQIEREGYVLKTLNIALEGRIPDDASMVIDIGAKTEFSLKEIDILKGYLDNGGKAIILACAFSNETTNDELNKLFGAYNISIRNDISIEPKRNFIGAQNIVIPIYESNPISDKLAQQKEFYMAIPDARSIASAGNSEDINIVSLLTTTYESWGETNFEQYLNKNIIKDDVDTKGPLVLASYVTKRVSGNKDMELVVIGNDLFVYDSLLSSTKSTANVEFFINSMTKLSPEENPITIKSKPLDIKQITLPFNKQKVVFFGVVVAVPLIILFFGLIVWLRRRNL